MKRNILTLLWTIIAINLTMGQALTDTGSKVGIGTTTPSQILHIEKSGNTFMRMVNSSTNGSVVNFGPVSSNGYKETQLQFESEFGLFDHSQSEWRFKIKSNGNVGIGNTNPNQMLTVGSNLNNAYSSTPYISSVGIMSHGVGTAQGNVFIHRDDVTISSDDVLGSLKFTGGDGGEQIGAEIRGISATSWNAGQSATDLAFLTTSLNSSTPTEKMKISSDGNVGIGTTNPSVKMEVHNSLVEEAFKLTTGTDGRVLTLRGETINFKRAGSNYIAASSSSGALNFSTGGSDIYNSQVRMRITSNGNVGIGTPDPLSKLSVAGQIRATEVKVLADITVPDYVFEPNYDLRTLKETKEYIAENKHLPEIPSAAEIGENGIDLGDMNMRLLKKIEELTLHLIEQSERVEKLEKEVSTLKNK